MTPEKRTQIAEQRAEYIDVLKNGLWVHKNPFKNPERGFISFGQMDPDIQELAKEIGIDNFYGLDGLGEWENGRREFLDGWTYCLRADYQEPKKEPELEYLEIKTDTIQKTRFFRLPDHVWPNNQVQILEGHLVTDAPSIIGFFGYAKEISLETGFQQTFTPDMKYVVIKKA